MKLIGVNGLCHHVASSQLLAPRAVFRVLAWLPLLRAARLQQLSTGWHLLPAPPTVAFRSPWITCQGEKGFQIKLSVRNRPLIGPYIYGDGAGLD